MIALYSELFISLLPLPLCVFTYNENVNTKCSFVVYFCVLFSNPSAYLKKYGDSLVVFFFFFYLLRLLLREIQLKVPSKKTKSIC